MKTRIRRRAAAGAVAALTTFVSACGGTNDDALPPHGEAVIVVDTDLPVPALASRLRVDLYDETGRWFESRDIGRSDPRDWPASFSVFSDDDTRDKRVLVRLRAYAEGVTRDYLGERYVPRTPFKPLAAAKDLTELCANVPELPLGGRVTMREGSAPVTQHVTGPTCTMSAEGGNIAARVTIATAGTYRFSVANAVPFISHTTLSLRARCADATSQIACRQPAISRDASLTAGHFPRFDARLEPGTYYVLTGGVSPDWPADITLEVLPVDGPLPTAPPIAATPPPAASAPRLRRLVAEDGTDPTPSSEPVPSATVDRLLLVRLVPGRQDRMQVVLRGECVGRMSRLGSDPTVPNAASATTCIDHDHESAPLVEETASAPALPGTVEGTFASGQACEPGSSSADRVCVPGGAFLMGSHLQFAEVSTVRRVTPEHVVALSRFWMDKNEVTVARFRAAVARGFVAAQPRIFVNDGQLADDAPGKQCTWSSVPRGREDYAVSCLTWRLAREFCRSEGGDLPTEAQWEYAATSAGRPFETLYSWGDDSGGCDRAVVERSEPVCTRSDGQSPPAGPAPVTAADGSNGSAGDVTPLGIVNLMGGVVEWTRDSAHTYDDACWLDAPIVDPICEEADAPFRVVKGGAWISYASPGFVRFHVPPAQGGVDRTGLDPPFSELGFRCVYGAPK